MPLFIVINYVINLKVHSFDWNDNRNGMDFSIQCWKTQAKSLVFFWFHVNKLYSELKFWLDCFAPHEKKTANQLFSSKHCRKYLFIMGEKWTEEKKLDTIAFFVILIVFRFWLSKKLVFYRYYMQCWSISLEN